MALKPQSYSEAESSPSVWHPQAIFTYGTLSVPHILQHILDLSDPPTYRAAATRWCKIKMLDGYPALTRSALDDIIEGFVYVVQTDKDLQKLVRYEGQAYKLMRCHVAMLDLPPQSDAEPAWMFAYCGPPESLRDGDFDRKTLTKKPMPNSSPIPPFQTRFDPGWPTLDETGAMGGHDSGRSIMAMKFQAYYEAGCPGPSPPVSEPQFIFTYGSLSVPENLQRILSLPEPPTYRAASIRGWAIKMFNRYPALVMSARIDTVRGFVYTIETEEQLQKLVRYEGTTFKLTRCFAKMEDLPLMANAEPARAFMYYGPKGLLEEGDYDPMALALKQVPRLADDGDHFALRDPDSRKGHNSEMSTMALKFQSYYEAGCPEPTLPVPRPQSLFTYGSLSIPRNLQRILSLPQSPSYRPAVIYESTIKMFNGYPVLIDGTDDDSVQGFVCTVQTQEELQRLVRYEGPNFRLASCFAKMGDLPAMANAEVARVFKYRGPKGLLEEGEYDRMALPLKQGFRVPDDPDHFTLRDPGTMEGHNSEMSTMALKFQSHYEAGCPEPTLPDSEPQLLFTYGSLSVAHNLQRILSLPTPPTYRPAVIFESAIKMFDGYPALIDGTDGDIVQGLVCTIETEEELQRLVRYEGPNFILTSCLAKMGDLPARANAEPARVFKFLGPKRLLRKESTTAQLCL